MRFTVVLLPAAILACDAAAAPVSDPDTIPVELTVTVLRNSDPGGICVDGGRGSLAVWASVFTANAGYTLSPTMERLGEGFVLTIDAEFTEIGVQVPMHYRYQAIVRELAPAQYPLTVVHRNLTAASEHTVFEGTVDVR
jgi:hypothetical protein